MNKIYGIWLVCILAMLLSACSPIFIKPLSDPTTSKQDERLFGTWIIKPEDKDEKGVGYIHIGKLVNGKPNVTIVSNNEEGELEIQNYIMFPTQTEKYNYLNIQIVDSEKPKQEYFLAEYFLDKENKKLSVWMITSDKLLEEAIKSEKLVGQIEYRERYKNGCAYKDRKVVRITDNGQNILSYFNSVDHTELFKHLYNCEKLEN